MLSSQASSSILMPSPRSSSFAFTQPSFLKHRYDVEQRSLPLKIDLSGPTPLPSWASLPTPPMSGTPPPEQFSEPHQLAGRRRKRDDTPPSLSREHIQPVATGINVSPLVEQTGQRYGEHLRAGTISDTSLMPSALTLPWEQPSGYGTPSAPGYMQDYRHNVAPAIPARPQQMSPRATRKTKAHVASACVNCKKRHLRCDETRPCKRCVQGAKEDTCRDVEHKKRGRPPLKPDEASGGRYTSTTNVLPPLGASASRSSYSQSLPPLLPTPTPNHMSFGPSYATPTVGQNPATAHGQFSAPSRPLSFPPARYQDLNIPHCGAGGPPPSYGYTQAAQPTDIYPNPDYPNPMFPRRPLPSQPLSSHAFHTYAGPPLQLPPILPAPPGTNIDPAIAQQQRHFQPQMQQYGQQAPSILSTSQVEHNSGERHPKRPKMDIRGILGPRE